MEKPSKRGKIPQQDWPSIITRYETGETLASIARTYDCSPPAISYIVSRSRARNAAATAATGGESTPPEPHLVEPPPTLTASAPITEGTAAQADSAAGSAALGGTDSVAGARSLAAADISGDVPAGTIPPAAPIAMTRPVGLPYPNEPRLFPDDAAHSPDSRREPFVPVRNGPAERSGHGSRNSYPQRDLNYPQRDLNAPHDLNSHRDSQPQRDPNPGGNGTTARSLASAEAGPQNGERRTLHLSLSQAGDNAHRPEAQRFQAQRSDPPAADSPSANPLERGTARPPSGPAGFGQPSRQGPGPSYPPSGNGDPMRAPNEARSKDAASFIDHTLRERVDSDIAAFLAAFDAALDHDTTESRTGLREATDRLLRAGARTRIELERLEARVPLAPRDRNPHFASAYRQR